MLTQETNKFNDRHCMKCLDILSHIKEAKQSDEWSSYVLNE